MRSVVNGRTSFLDRLLFHQAGAHHNNATTSKEGARWERTWARPRATARASSPSSTTASDGTARRSSRARVGCVRAPSRPAPLRFSVFRYSPEIGQPERPRRARLSTYPPSPRPTDPHAAVHTEYRGGQRRRRLERRRAAHLLHLDRARGPVVLRRSPWRRLDLLRRDAHRARRSRPSRRERRARGVRARGVGGAAPRGGTIRAHRRRALGAGRTPPTRRRRRPVRRLRLRLRLRRGSRLRPSETAPRPAPRDRAPRPAAAAADERRGRHELPLRRVALRRGGSTGERRSIDDDDDDERGAIRFSRGRRRRRRRRSIPSAWSASSRRAPRSTRTATCPAPFAPACRGLRCA